MIYIYAILALATGVILALKGLKNYRLLLSLAVTVSNGSLYLSVSEFQPDALSPLTAIIIAIVSGVITYLFARWITYLWVWTFQFYLILSVMIIFISPESLGSGLVLGLLFFGPIIGTFLMRRQIKPIVIGLMSGFSSGIGLSVIVTLLLLESTSLGNMDFESLMNNIKIPAMLLVVCTLAGVFFQYFYILKKDPELSKI
jgi:zinc transporter ZupT